LNQTVNATLSAAQLLAIARADAARAPRTSRLVLDGRTVVVKREQPRRLALGYRILSLLAWLAGQPWLRGVPLPGGAQGQAVEVARLRQLGQAGVAVPSVLHVADGYFVMDHVPGADLASLLPREPEAMRSRWNLGLHFLRDVHARGQCLSQAFARNLILGPRGIVAIDFEDDPLSLMPLAAAQTRDWLAYLLSTLWMLPHQQAWVLDELEAALHGAAPAVRRGLRDTARRWGWLRRLPNRRRPWGRDLVSVQALAQTMVLWASRCGAD
jgi:hypothetical protein